MHDVQFLLWPAHQYEENEKQMTNCLRWPCRVRWGHCLLNISRPKTYSFSRQLAEVQLLQIHQQESVLRFSAKFEKHREKKQNFEWSKLYSGKLNLSTVQTIQNFYKPSKQPRSKNNKVLLQVTSCKFQVSSFKFLVLHRLRSCYHGYTKWWRKQRYGVASFLFHIDYVDVIMDVQNDERAEKFDRYFQKAANMQRLLKLLNIEFVKLSKFIRPAN